ncbi:VTT domain-containing protein [Streptomyces sp. WMMC905]|uniref:DedA family protein n=1 Tax=Streptomyces sp. WMMC905 TaxID=3404123 RepID=UPI003B946A4B
MTTLALGPEWLSPDYLISTFSLPGILLIVFAESGFFAFLPGDSLLFTAGLFVAQGEYISQPLWLVCLLIVLAAVLGDQVGYTIGKVFGPKIFNRPNSRLFKQENLEKAHDFMEKYGPKAIVLARFVPIVRTFAPITAGAGRMKYRTFLTYNVTGGILWGTGVTLAGYWLGQIELIRTNVESILILIVFLSVVPIIVEYLRERSKNKRAAAAEPSAAPESERAPYPVMDDATTRLRRIDPAQERYAHEYGSPYPPAEPRRPRHPEGGAPQAGQAPAHPYTPPDPHHAQAPHPAQETWHAPGPYPGQDFRGGPTGPYSTPGSAPHDGRGDQDPRATYDGRRDHRQPHGGQ